MPGIILFTMIVVIAVIVLLFLHDTRQHQSQGQKPSNPSPQRQPQRLRPPDPPPPEEPEPQDVDVEGLAEHVRELRRAIDEGLIGRDEAVGSIVRQAEGKVGEGLAERLLDTAELE